MVLNQGTEQNFTRIQKVNKLASGKMMISSRVNSSLAISSYIMEVMKINSFMDMGSSMIQVDIFIKAILRWAQNKVRGRWKSKEISTKVISWITN